MESISSETGQGNTGTGECVMQSRKIATTVQVSEDKRIKMQISGFPC
jgi:hypothetical protein